MAPRKDKMGIFNPVDRANTSAQNPQSGGSNWSRTRQVINAIFGRTPLFYNAGLADAIAPIVDTSLYYPLTPLIKLQTVTVDAFGGFNITWKPDKGKHWMVYACNISNAVILAAPAIIVASLVVDNNANSVPLISYQLLEKTDVNELPIINSKTTTIDQLTTGTEPIVITFEGFKSLYLSSSMALNIGGLGYTPGNLQGSDILFLELPDNQPFGPGLTL